MQSLHEYNIKKLKDPEDASLYLTEAQGGVGELAKKTSLNRQNLYKLLSAKRQPKIETLGAILDGLGFRLSIVPKNLSSMAEHKR